MQAILKGRVLQGQQTCQRFANGSWNAELVVRGMRWTAVALMTSQRLPDIQIEPNEERLVTRAIMGAPQSTMTLTRTPSGVRNDLSAQVIAGTVACRQSLFPEGLLQPECRDRPPSPGCRLDLRQSVALALPVP